MNLWRSMKPGDLDCVLQIAAIVHAEFPEDPEVFEERLSLYPEGCFMLEGENGRFGYLFGHPWFFRSPPPLNSRLGSLPEYPGTYYLHDLAILPGGRSGGYGSAIVLEEMARARRNRFPSLSLISVHSSFPFWQKLGFVGDESPELSEKLASYGDKARFMVCALGKSRTPQATVTTV